MFNFRLSPRRDPADNVPWLLQALDTEAALVAAALPALAAPFLQRTRSHVLCLCFDPRSGAVETPALHVWPAEGQGREAESSLVGVERDYGSQVEKRLLCAGQLVLCGLVNCWPLGTLPSRIGIGTDGRDLMFDRGDPDPLAPGWIERRTLAQYRASGLCAN